MSGSLGNIALRHTPNAWVYQPGSGECADGHFTTDNPQSDSTTVIELSSVNEAGSNSQFVTGITIGSTITFSSADGETASFKIVGMWPDEDTGCSMITVILPKGSLTWSGRYSINFLPAV